MLITKGPNMGNFLVRSSLKLMANLELSNAFWKDTKLVLSVIILRQNQDPNDTSKLQITSHTTPIMSSIT